MRQSRSERSGSEAHSDLEKKVLRIWQELLGAGSSGTRDNFFDCGGHSLLAVRFLYRVESELGVNLPLALFFQNPTVEGVAQAIERQKGLARWPALVSIRPSGWRPPFFCIHPFCGDVVGFGIWTKYLDDEQPFYGLRARGLDGIGSPSDRIEDMAAEYIEAIQGIQPTGPYYLGGYGPGSVTAFEMARQLRVAGEEVALTAVINCAAPGSSYHSIDWSPRFPLRLLRNLPYWIAELARLGYAKSVFRFHELLRREVLVSRMARSLRLVTLLQSAKLKLKAKARQVIDEHDLARLDSGGVPTTHEMRQSRVARAHRDALAGYLPPGSYPGDLVVFRTKRQPLLCSFAPDLGWSEIVTGRIQVIEIPGSTRALLKEPYARSFAKEWGGSSSRSNPGRNPAGPSGSYLRCRLSRILTQGFTCVHVSFGLDNHRLQCSCLPDSRVKSERRVARPALERSDWPMTFPQNLANKIPHLDYDLF